MVILEGCILRAAPCRPIHKHSFTCKTVLLPDLLFVNLPLHLTLINRLPSLHAHPFSSNTHRLNPTQSRSASASFSLAQVEQGFRKGSHLAC
jgi:hypothetical protein